MEEAFQALVAANHGKLVGWLHKQIGDWQVAEDIAQETFFRLWQNREKVHGWNKSLLYRAASYRMIDTLRKKRPAIEPLETSLQSTNPVHDPVACAEKDEELRAATRHLGTDLARFVNGDSYKNLASGGQTAVGTVKSRLAYHRDRLKRQAELERVVRPVVVEMVRTRTFVTAKQVAERCGLATQPVHAFMDEMVEDGVLVEVEVVAPGKPIRCVRKNQVVEFAYALRAKHERHLAM